MLRLSDAIERARAENPEIQAARERSNAARFVPARASAYEDPTFTYEGFNVPESLNLRRTDNNILKLSQKVPFPGKLRLAGRAAERDADMAAGELRAVDIDIVARVKRAYHELWKAREDLQVYERDRVLVARFAEVAERRYALGLVSQPDVLRAQVERTRLVNRVTTAGFSADVASAELNALLSRPPDEHIGTLDLPVANGLDTEPSALTEKALAHRPEIAAQAAAVAREETKRRSARLDYLPDFDVTLERFLNSGRSDGFGAVLSISIPLAYKYKYDAAYSETSARLAAAKADLRRLEDRVRREVSQAHLRARTALAERDLYRTTHIPQAEQALQASEAAYQTGKIDFLSLIDSVRAIESIHLEHIEAEANLGKALADLVQATGDDADLGERR